MNLQGNDAEDHVDFEYHEEDMFMFSWDGPAEEYLNEHGLSDKLVKVLNAMPPSDNVPTVFQFFKHVNSGKDKDLPQTFNRAVWKSLHVIWTDIFKVNDEIKKNWEVTMYDLSHDERVFPVNAFPESDAQGMKNIKLIDYRYKPSENGSDTGKLRVALNKICCAFDVVVNAYFAVWKANKQLLIPYATEWDNNHDVWDLIRQPAVTEKHDNFGNIFKLVKAKCTLDDLIQKLQNVDFSIALKQTGVDTDTVFKILDKVEADESLLNDQYLTYKAKQTYLNNIKKEYVSGCMSGNLRHPRDGIDPNKNLETYIVSGPSGSGKTLCSVMHIPTVDTPDSDTGLHKCVVYLASEHIEASPVESIPKLVSEIVGRKLGRSSVPKLLTRTRLSVIIDEAYSIVDRLGSVEKLQIIRADLLETVCEHTRLIICGTGYDTVSHRFSTEADVRKFDMKPWDRTHFLKKAVAEDSINGKLISEAVEKSHLLLAMTTNARAANLLIRSLKTTRWHRSLNDIKNARGILKNNPRSIADDEVPDLSHQECASLVSTVADEYMTMNGLAETTKQQRRLIAHSVLDELHNATHFIHKRITYPQFQKLRALVTHEQPEIVIDEHGHLGNEGVKTCIEKLVPKALCLLSINMEVDKEGNLEKVTGDIPVEVTPAITLVLCRMLGISAEIFTGWEGLEKVAALDAFFTAVRTDKLEDTWKWKIVELSSPIPATSGWNSKGKPDENAKCKVPINVCNMVFVNGPMAPYADIIAPRKLIQVKQTSGNSVDVDLVHELGKVGLLQDDEVVNHQLVPSDKEKTPIQFRRTRMIGGAVTSYFSLGWASFSAGPDSGSKAGDNNAAAQSKQIPTNTEHAFPAKLLNIPQDKDSGVIMQELVFTSLNDDAARQSEKTKQQGKSQKPKISKEDVDEQVLMSSAWKCGASITDVGPIPLIIQNSDLLTENNLDFILFTNAERINLAMVAKHANNAQSDNSAEAKSLATTEPTVAKRDEKKPYNQTCFTKVVQITKDDVGAEGQLIGADENCNAIAAFHNDFVVNGVNLRFMFLDK
mmetsp:Transcript_9863/g.27928  ORF Transcript_9863/g.27928 Transcript_9863/m.27928 type:complete len:1049 (+) Transcript_9863:379-3525(+)|eukprot:CAMPEP_0119549026 /NCGR_PEP_ID=MMETSP1352-20130426/2813_1 /TAXON_ID=265584 /ORGANISM="Stauroneis constricta, Strain CCMP1120" /LENGTH=1048 /DNA_ID=CAMNT_0007594459 /DNA_START=161 /DNA_END=3307 /DNA_ORIENTATION=+